MKCIRIFDTEATHIWGQALLFFLFCLVCGKLKIAKSRLLEHPAVHFLLGLPVLLHGLKQGLNSFIIYYLSTISVLDRTFVEKLIERPYMSTLLPHRHRFGNLLKLKKADNLNWDYAVTFC